MPDETEAAEVDEADGAVEASSEEAEVGAVEDEEVEQLRGEVEALRESNRELEEERDDLESRLKRVQADFENYKKRAEEKVERARRRGVEEVVEEVVGVKDDLERALEAEGDVDLGDSLELLDEQIEQMLRGIGVERVEPDTELDPEKHEAVMRVDSADHEEGEVVDVHEPGYVLGDRVVRTAKVSVAAGGSGEDDE